MNDIIDKLLYAMLMIVAVLLIVIGIQAIILFNHIIAKEVKAEEPQVCEVVEKVVEEKVELPAPTPTEVYFTNYYVGDGYYTTAKTGSGLTTDDFEVNEYGWYTYDGKVVVATATIEGLLSEYGVLANYSEAEEGITYYRYFDTFKARIEGVVFEFIVLDTCGASMNIEYLKEHDEGLNRIDIFVAGKENTFGKVKGIMYEDRVD